MKQNLFARTALALGLTASIAFTPVAALADTGASPVIARTKAWDGITHTLGGIPESVKKITYAGSVFYLAQDVTEADFRAVLAAGPESVRMKPPKDNGKLYNYPAYILWNEDKTALLVHPIIFDYDDVLDAVSVPAEPPAGLTGAPKAAPKKAYYPEETLKYMLSAEYADAVRTEFYRLLNEHRAANGLRELKVNTELQGYADLRAEEQRARFGHTRPNDSPAGSGWHNSRNNMGSRYAENALKTGAVNPDPNDTAWGIFSIWKASEGHNRHMIYDFGPDTTMALGLAPKLDETGFVTSGAIFATGY